MKFFNALAKWILDLALALSAGLLVIIFLSSRPEFGAYLLRLILLAAIGFTGGLAARIFFRKLPAIAVVILTAVSNLIAVLSIDHFYETAFQFQLLKNDFHFQVPTASDGGQFLLMTLVSLLPLLLFRPAVKKISKAQKAPAIKKTQRSLSQYIQPVLSKADPRNWIKKQKTRPVKRDPVRTAAIEKPVLAVARPKPVKPVSQPVAIRKNSSIKPTLKRLKLPGKLFKGNQADVKLVGEEEHCCPYCLDEVVKGDSRGVTVCPECGTWHHQDCWNLTGSCGVAHRTEL